MTLQQALKSKTLWYAVAIAVLGALETQIKIIPPDYQGFVLIMIAGGIALFRQLTNQALSEK